MKFERTDPFKADYQRLSEDERKMFHEAARAFNKGCDRFVETKDPSSWPASLRVKPVVNVPGIFRDDVELQRTRRPGDMAMDDDGR